MEENYLPLPFLCACVFVHCRDNQNTEMYHSHTRPHIKHWIQLMEESGRTEGREGGKGVCADCVIVYCITPEVRAKRQRTLTKINPSHMEENIKSDFKGKE